VRVRVAVGVSFDERVVYSAGTEPFDGLPALDGIPAATLEPRTSGVATITEEPYEVTPAQTFHLEVVTRPVGVGSSRHREDSHLLLAEALAVARARADVVIVRTGVPGSYKDYNAGTEDLPSPGPLPRWTRS